MRILLVDDDPDFTRFVAARLRAQGHEVVVRADGPSALRVTRSSGFDIVLLDVKLPGMDGLQILRTIRAQGHTCPILMLTAQTSHALVVKALDAGADDYLRKPFHPAELEARLRALRRRTNSPDARELRFDDITVDQAEDTVSVRGRLLSLTGTEYRLLRALVAAGGEPVPFEELVQGRGRDGKEATGPGPRTRHNLVSHISNLRSKLAEVGRDGVIQAVRGVGYRLVR